MDRTRSTAVNSPKPVHPHAAHTRAKETRPPAHTASPSGGASRKRPRRGRGALVALGALAGLALVVYVAGAIVFSQVYYPGTSIAGVDVSLMGRDTATNRVKSALTGYRLTVSGGGFSWTYKPESGSFEVDAGGVASRALAANDSLAWPVRLASSLTGGGSAADEGSYEVSYDKDAFAQSLDAAVDAFNEGRSGTVDAAGAYDADAGAFTVEQIRSNQKLDKKKAGEAAAQAVERLDRKLALSGDDFEGIAGSATDDELQAACDEANAMLGTDLTLTMGGAQVATVDGAAVAQWITFGDDLKPTFNDDALTAWVHDLAVNTLDTVGTQRTYTREDGKQITVSGGVWGWTSDEAALTQALKDAVAKHQTGELAVPTTQTADVFTAHGERDWGSYVDVDLGEQHARYYDASGNIIWESNFISGNPNKDYATPTGVYKVNALTPNSVLKGQIDPSTGKPSYETPVAYWMPFEENLVGFHDATWQAAASFNDPNAYLTVGSKGCINLPLDKAAELFGVLKVGVCVVVHA